MLHMSTQTGENSKTTLNNFNRPGGCGLKLGAEGIGQRKTNALIFSIAKKI